MPSLEWLGGGTQPIGGCLKMVQTLASQAFPDLSPVTIRALSSLTRRDADVVRATVRAAGAAHAVQEHDDYDGYLSVLLTPPLETELSFLVSGRTGAVDVSALEGDSLASLGRFASIGAAMQVLRQVLDKDQWR